MSRRTSRSVSGAQGEPLRRRSPGGRPAAGAAPDSPGPAARSRRPTRSASGILRTVDQLIRTMGRDARFLRRLAEFHGTIVVLSATDTGRELAIVLDGQGVRAHPHDGGPFDVKIRATERVHQAVLFGEMDPDAAFFTGRVRILGSLVTAFRVKNRFLSLLQQYLSPVSAKPWAQRP